MNTIMVLKCLADDTRLSVVRHLAGMQNCEIAYGQIVGDCSLALNLSQPTMSHHFKLLVRSGVLSERKVKTEKYYRLNRDQLMMIGIDTAKL